MVKNNGDEVARISNNTLHVSKHSIKAADGSVAFRSADEVNAAFIASGYNPPYKFDTEVIEFLSDQEEQFVRVFYDGGSGPIGKWILKQSDIVGKTPQQIKDLLALPGDFPPNKIIPVSIPEGIEIRTGTVAPNF